MQSPTSSGRIAVHGKCMHNVQRRYQHRKYKLKMPATRALNQYTDEKNYVSLFATHDDYRLIVSSRKYPCGSHRPKIDCNDVAAGIEIGWCCAWNICRRRGPGNRIERRKSGVGAVANCKYGWRECSNLETARSCERFHPGWTSSGNG